MRRPRNIKSYGKEALLIEWEHRIVPEVSASVHAFATALLDHPAVLECVPAYASLLVRFAAAKTTVYDLREFVYGLQPTIRTAPGLLHELPVCYEKPYALDVQDPALAALHAARDYRVYQLGFRPGFAFLGDTAAELYRPRLASPRPRVPAGAVGLAGAQTGVYPAEGPGGWAIIGRCPLPLVESEKGRVRLRAGDRVRFRAVSGEEFNHLLQNPTPWPER